MSMSDQTELRSDRGHKPRKKWLTPVVGVAIWLGCVTLTTSVICGGVWFLNATRVPTHSEIDKSLWGSREKKRSSLRDAYAGHRVEISDPRREEIETFLRGIAKPAPENERPKWKDALDESRFRQRILQSPWLSAISLLNRRSFSSKPLDEFSINGPNESSNIDLVRIEPWAPSGGEELLVYTYAQRGYRETEPLLFWVHQVAGEWKLVDWEFVDSGASAAELAGMYESAYAHQYGFAYREAQAYLERADAVRYSDEQEFDRQLRQAEGCRVPPQVEPMMQYSIMNRWGNRHRNPEVLRMMRLIREPDRIPGTLVITATACQELGDTEESLKFIGQLEQLVGIRSDLAMSRAQMLQWAGQRDEAIAEWRQVLDMKTDDFSALVTLHKLLPKSQRGEILDRIKAAHEPAKFAVQFAAYTSSQIERSFLGELRQFVQDVAPGSDEAREIEVACLRQDHDYLAAAALYRKAAEQQTDTEKSDSNWMSYLQEMNSAGELGTALNQHPNPRRAFQELTRGVEDSEGMVSQEDMPSLLAAYREKQPNDPWLHYYEGLALVERDQWEPARQSFDAAKKLVDKQERALKDEPDESIDQSDLDMLKNYLKYQIGRVRYELGEDVQILIDYQHDVAVYQSLSSLAIQHHHWKALDRLNRAFAVHQPSNGQLLLNQAREFLAAKNFRALEDKLRRVASRESQESWLKYSREQIDLERLLAEYPDPIEAFTHSSNRISAFNVLSRQLLTERDWGNLDKLCEQHRGFGNDKSILIARLELAWRRSDDEKLVAGLVPWPDALSERFTYIGSTWRDRLVRSLIRLGRTDEAYRRAVGFSDHFGETWPLVIVHVSRRDGNAIMKMLDDDESLVESFELKDFADDSALRPVLVAPEFVELRKRLRFGLPWNRVEDDVVLLLSRERELTEEWLRRRLSDEKDEASTSLQITAVSPQKMIVDWKGSRFLVSAEASPYFGADVLDSSTYRSRIKDADLELETVLKLQSAYWRVQSLLAVDDFGWDAPVVSARELAARIVPPEIIGAVNQSSLTGLAAVVALTESPSELLASRRPLSELNIPIMLFRSKSSGQLGESSTTKSLVERATKPSLDQHPLSLTVRIGSSNNGLAAKFRTLEAARSRYGGVQLVAEYAGDEPYPGIPELRSGIRYLIPVSQIIEATEQAE